MTTYTITDAQREQLMTDSDAAACYRLLQSLQPNTQEPVGWLIDGLDVVMSHTHAQAEQAEHHAMGGTAVAYPIYTHPAPQAKPLTVQEVEQILAQHNYELHGDRARYIVRMTEQAHGVKP